MFWQGCFFLFCGVVIFVSKNLNFEKPATTVWKWSNHFVMWHTDHELREIQVFYMYIYALHRVQLADLHRLKSVSGVRTHSFLVKLGEDRRKYQEKTHTSIKQHCSASSRFSWNLDILLTWRFLPVKVKLTATKRSLWHLLI